MQYHTPKKSDRYYGNAINTLARELAEHLGGRHVAADRDGELWENFAKIYFDATPNCPASILDIDTRGWGSSKGKATAQHYPAELVSDVMKSGPWPSCGFGMERAVPAIARHLVNKIFTKEGAAQLSEYAANVATFRANQSRLREHVFAMTGLPNVRLARDFDPDRSYRAELYSKGETIGFHAFVQNDGRVSFSRIDSMSNDAAKRILAILAETIGQ